MRCYLTQDGKAGMAITRSGDVVSLFSSGGGYSMGKLIPTAVALGGRKLDCYGMGLQNMYSRYGARAISQTAFVDDYAPSDWNGQDRPPVVAMILPRSVDEIVRKYDKGRSVDMARVKEYDDYDAMIEARDKVLKREDRKLSAAGSKIRGLYGMGR